MSTATHNPKRTRSSQLLDELRQAILTGDLKPGEKVNLERLREAHDVSLSPMREAVSRLIAERLVKFEDLRGYRIAPISPENLAEVTQLRADTESLALRYAITRAGLDWEGGIPAALHRLRRASEAGSKSEAISAHEAFHDALIKGCGMPMLLDFAGVLRNLHLRYRNVADYSVDGRDLGAEHAAIAEATLARDTDLAPTLLRRHIERSGEELRVRLFQP